MAEERVDVVVDPSSGKRGIDVLIQTWNKYIGVTKQAEGATTRMFDMLNKGLSRVESLVFSFKALAALFVTIIGGFKQIGDEITRFQAFTSAMSVSVGGAKEARTEYDHLMKMADRLGISINSLSHNYSQLTAAAKHSGMTMENVRNIFESFSVAARVMHLSGQDTRLMFYALTQMVSKGVVSMEELRRQLGEKLPGAMNIAASSLGVAMPELEAAIRKGIVDSAKFLPIFADAVRQTFGPGLANAMVALDAEINRMTNSLQKMIIVFYELGVADSFRVVIQEINRILSDRGIAEEFAKAIKRVADGVGDFLKTITPQKVREFIHNFSSALQVMSDTITKTVLPAVRELAGLLMKAAAAYVVVKSAGVGAAAGGAIAGPKGAIIGGIGGAAAGAGAVAAFNNAMSGVEPQTHAGQFSSGKITGQPPAPYSNPIFLDQLEEGLAAYTKTRNRLDEVTGGSGKGNKRTPFDNALLSLQHKGDQSNNNLFVSTSIDIQAEKYGKLTEAQKQQLLTAAALAEQTKSEVALRTELNQQLGAGATATNQLVEQQKMDAYNSVKAIEESFEGPEAEINRRFKEQYDAVNEARRLDVIDAEKQNQLLYFIEEKHLDALEQLRIKKMTETQRLQAMTYRQQAKFVTNELVNMTASVAQHSRTMFEIHKAASIGLIILKGIESVQSAYAWGNAIGGPVMGAIAAGIAGAASLAQLQMAKNAKFGDSGATSSPVDSPAIPTTPVGEVPAPAGGVQTRIYKIEIHASAVHRDVIEQIADGLKEITDDGFPAIFEVETV